MSSAQTFHFRLLASDLQYFFSSLGYFNHPAGGGAGPSVDGTEAAEATAVRLQTATMAARLQTTVSTACGDGNLRRWRSLKV